MTQSQHSAGGFDAGFSGVYDTLLAKDRSGQEKEDLISDFDDLVDVVAYCLYQRQKKEYFTAQCIHSTDAKAKDFRDIQVHNIQHFQATAENFVNDFLEQIYQTALDDAMNQTLQNLNSTVVATLQEAIEKATGFWKSIAINVLSSVIFALITLIITVYAAISNEETVVKWIKYFQSAPVSQEELRPSKEGMPASSLNDKAILNDAVIESK